MRNKTIIYDLYETKCYKNQYINTLKNNGFVEVIFKNNKGTTDPNLIYENTESNYKTRKLAVIPHIHKLPFNCDGELIIELEPITNGDHFVYIVVPLKTKKNIEPTVIDRLIQQDFDNELAINLNNIIVSKKCYVNKKGIVFIMENMLLVKEDFSKFKDINEKYFANYTHNQYFKNPISKPTDDMNGNNKEEPDTTEGFQEGLDGDEVDMNGAVECTPIGAYGEKINTSSYTLPTGSAIANKLDELNVMGTASNYFLFFIVSVIIYFITPFFYRITALNIVNKLVTEEKNRPGVLVALDTVLRTIFIGLPAYLMIIGVFAKNSTAIAIGFLMLAFILVGIFIIEYMKKTEYTKFALTKDNTAIIPFRAEFLYFLIGLITSKIGYSVIKPWIILVILLTIILFTIAQAKKFNSNKSKNFNYKTAGILYSGIILFSIPLLSIIMLNFCS